MDTLFLLLVLFCLAISFLSGSGGFTPAECAEVDKYVKEGGRGSLAYYIRDYWKQDLVDTNSIHKYVTFLVSQGADVNVEVSSLNRVTPLHWVALRGNIGTVKFLVSKGANVNAKDKDGKTPLHWAGNREIVEFLIFEGANVNVKDNFGKNPLDSAMISEITGSDIENL